MSVLYVKEQGAYLRMRSGRYVVSKNDEELVSIPEASLDGVVLMGNVQASAQALSGLLGLGIDVVFTTLGGRLKGRLVPAEQRNPFARISQIEAHLRDGLSFSIAKSIVVAKMGSQLSTLRHWQLRKWIGVIGDRTKLISGYRREAAAAEDMDFLLGMEGAAAKAYFSAFSEVVPPPFEWSGRNRRPPKDPVNALLSLTYMTTLNHIATACVVKGFDIAVGFLHHLEYSRPSFALDLLELCRSSHCDRFVVSLLQREVFDHSDFRYDDGNGCRMSKKALAVYFEHYERFFKSSGGTTRSLANQIALALADLKEMFSTKRAQAFS